MATTAISSMIFGRHPHERLETREEDDANSLVEDEESPTSTITSATTTTTTPSNNNNSNNNNDDDVIVETISSDDEETEDEQDPENPTLIPSTEEDEDQGYFAHTIPRETTTTTATTATASTSRNTVTLAELEEERELARRRTSACVLLAVFVLFRLWVEALQNGDVFVMMICLFGTSWTARLIRHNREREEALDERIRRYLENADPNTTEIDRNDLRFLSFQAQLALAMMESQRQMAAGGFGHPDGPNGAASQGLSDEAKNQWERFQFKDTEEEKNALKKGDYGAVAQKDVLGYEEDGPHCSICLGEYEDGEKLVKLPCNHIYHEDCVGSWTTNHTRCPLCNCDLESVATTEGTSPEQEGEEIV